MQIGPESPCESREEVVVGGNFYRSLCDNVFN